MEPLSSKQQTVLNYIADAQSSRGSPPLLREIAAAFSLSVPGAQKYVRILRKKGYLTVEPFAHRGIRLTSDRKAWKVRRAWQNDFERRIGSRLRGETDLARIFGIVRGELRAWLDVERADLYVEEPDRRRLRTGAFFGVPLLPDAPGAGTSAEDAPHTPALKGAEGSPSGPPIATPAGGTDTSDPQDPLAEKAFRRRRPSIGDEGAAVPVPGRDGPVGVLRLTDRRGSAVLDDVRMSRAAAAAAALGPALEQARLNADLQRRIRMQAALISLCRTVNAVDDLKRVLHETWDIVRNLVGVECGLIAVKDDFDQWWMLLMTDVIDGKPWEDDTIHPVHTTPNEAIRAIFTRPYYIKLRTPEEVAQIEAADRAVSKDGWERVGDPKRRSRSFLYVPLKVGGEVIGYLSAQRYEYDAYSLRHAEDLALISEYIALAIQNAWRRDREKAAAKEVKKDLLDPLRIAVADRAMKGVQRLSADLRRRVEFEKGPLRDILDNLARKLDDVALGYVEG